MTTPTEPSGGYAKGRKRRESIINAAYDYFSSYGYQGSSLRDISSSIGVTHAGLRYHFEAKEELLIAVLQKFAQESDEIFSIDTINKASETNCPWSAISSFLESIQFSLDNRGFIRLFSAQALLSSEPGNLTYEYFAEHRHTDRSNLAKFMELLQEQQVARPEIRPQHAATLLLATLDGLYMEHLLLPDQRNVMTHVHLFLQSLCLPEAHEQMAKTFDPTSALLAA